MMNNINFDNLFQDMSEEKKEKKAVPANTKRSDDKKRKSNETADKKDKSSKDEKWEYPFSLFFLNKFIDISSFGFEEGKSYSGKEISEIMLNHKQYAFSGDISYAYIEEDNVLTVNQKQYKKG